MERGVVEAGTLCCDQSVALTDDIKVCYALHVENATEEQACIDRVGVTPVLDGECGTDHAWMQCCRPSEVMEVRQCVPVTDNLSVAHVTCAAPTQSDRIAK